MVAAIKPYFDGDLEDRLDEADNEADHLADEEWEATIEEEAEQLEQLRADADAVTKKYEV